MKVLALTILGSTMLASAGQAQTRRDTAEVVGVALQHAAVITGRRTYAIDTTDYEARQHGARAQALRRSTNQAVREAAPAARHGRQADFVSCTTEGRRDVCTWNGADATIHFGVPVFAGDTARIGVDIRRRLWQSRSPYSEVDETYVLVRQRGRWVFVRTDGTRLT